MVGEKKFHEEEILVAGVFHLFNSLGGRSLLQPAAVRPGSQGL
jgi:hypothetical protein